MKANYHTHLHFCNHAVGNSEDYVKEAIKHDFKEIGISDHAPNSEMIDHHVRMSTDKFPLYLKDIENAKEKYSDKIKVLKGIEVEYWYNRDDYYKELSSKLDYMIHGQHYISLDKTMNNLISGFALGTKEQIYVYAEYLMSAMDSGYFVALAHPDLYMCGYREFDEHAEKVADMICKKALETDTILEFNANGFNRGVVKTSTGYKRPYPRDEFWNVAKKYGVKTMINSDCHTPGNLYDIAIREAEEVYKNLGLKTVEFLPIK